MVDRQRGGNVLVALQAYAGEIGAREFVGKCRCSIDLFIQYLWWLAMVGATAVVMVEVVREEAKEEGAMAVVMVAVVKVVAKAAVARVAETAVVERAAARAAAATVVATVAAD